MFVRLAHLVSEDPAATALSIDLSVVDSCKIIKRHLAIGVEDEHWQEDTLVEVFDQEVE